MLSAHGIAEENLLLVIVPYMTVPSSSEKPQRVTIARARLGCLLDIGLRAGGDLLLAEDDLFRNPAAHADGEPRGHLFVAHRKLVAFGKLHDHARGHGRAE